jgi:hypothetical protein
MISLQRINVQPMLVATVHYYRMVLVLVYICILVSYNLILSTAMLLV